MSDIFERDRNGQVISDTDRDVKKILKIISNTQKLLKKINCKSLSEKKKYQLFTKVIGKKIADNFMFLTPIHIDFGKNIVIGNNVFINFNCSFLDRGTIKIGDNVLIGPNCNIFTTNHPIAPKNRKSTISKAITIKNDVWIGGNVTILPGITINANSIVGAGSVVTKDVPENVIVAGNPAKVIKNII